MQVYLDANRHVYLEVYVGEKKKEHVFLTLNGRRRGLRVVRLTPPQMLQIGLQLKDYDPMHVVNTWVESGLHKAPTAQAWINKILADSQSTGGSIPLFKEYQMFYIVSKTGELLGQADNKKEIDGDFAGLDESERLASSILSSEADLAATLSISALLALGNSEDVLAGGPEFTKFKNKADGAKQVWELLELAFNPKVKAAAEKAAKAAAKEAEKAAKEKAKEDAKAAKVAAKADKPAKVNGNGVRGTRTTWGGKAYKVVGANPARAGTKRAALLDAILEDTDTTQVLGKVVTYSGGDATVTGADVKFAVELGIIQLSA